LPKAQTYFYFNTAIKAIFY